MSMGSGPDSDTVWLFFVFETLLDGGRDLAEILCQASDCFPAARFVLDAIEAGENAGAGIGAANSRGKSRNGIKANRG